MNIKDEKQENIRDKNHRVNLKSVKSRVSEPNSIRPSLADNYYKNVGRPQIISGYFIQDKSYKEAIISKVNTALCLVISALIVICMISYYFVISCEIELNKMSKETLALNYENEELQAELDRRQSYSNVDKVVSASHDLKRANRILEVSVKDIPIVNRKNKNYKETPAWKLGY